MPRKEFIADHRERGLCTRCMNIPVPGFSTCEKHQQESRAQHQSYRGTGRCHNCGQLAEEGKGRCILCSVDNRARTKKMSAEERQRATDAFTVFDGRCQICGTTDPSGGHDGRGWNLDHDHATGKFRGILCARCNKGLAFFQDSPVKLLKAIQYLFRVVIQRFS